MMAPTALSETPESAAKQADARPIRVMVVDDSLIVRTILSRVIDPEPDMEIVAKVSSGELALSELARTSADVVLLDLDMPGMGGLETLPRLLAARPRLPVLVVSSLTEAGAEHTLAALAMGAADTMLKPRSGQFDEEYRRALVQRVRALAKLEPMPACEKVTPPVRSAPGRPHAPALIPSVIAVGASTGGIHALGQLLRHLPGGVSQPLVVVQHLPASFAKVFARQLQLASDRETIVGEDGMQLMPGRIYVASGASHLLVQQHGDALVLGSSTKPAPSGCTPSVDPLFESLARTAGARTLAVVLSGMGRDGALGAVDLVRAGGRILVQDQASSAVWGMPRAIVEAGLAEAILPPDQLGIRIAAFCGLGR
ncbi:chemotaxis-specific protein-glutamate methyltransferase CheB [Altererythrobacter sp. H2]|uniref:chemotaxis-specific protein-glutamate methyltransferase CheB n=1 Tax=Altererythrobacter sp. H2 TaxID=3108391 RepID=UPI002B4BDC6F|nr:chemotaxis-specific protein-glutamate methyltransferase CheB [Altererythrobacter sp. H2]WRK95623.1 chemotaxis-specific protein-glutamate methyltransferase CheB [Altererythrobacter sp. H2]